MESFRTIWNRVGDGLELLGGADVWFSHRGASDRGGVFSIFCVPVFCKDGFPNDAIEPVSSDIVCGDGVAVWFGALSVAGWGNLRDGVSVAGDQEESAGGRDDGACDHEFFVGSVDCVEGGLEVLVRRLEMGLVGPMGPMRDDTLRSV